MNLLIESNILSEVQSGFRSGHSTTAAAMAVVNYIINALDKKQHCAALFVGLSKAFDSVDHELLLARLRNIGLSEGTVNCFRNYLSDRTQCVYTDNQKSSYLEINRGVPQGSILAPVLFSICSNGMQPAKLHLYADDKVIYSCAPSLVQAVEELQTAFQTLPPFMVSNWS